MSDVFRKAVCLGLMPLIVAGLWAIASFNAVSVPKQVHVSPNESDAPGSSMILTLADPVTARVDGIDHWMNPIDYVSISDGSDVN